MASEPTVQKDMMKAAWMAFITEWMRLKDVGASDDYQCLELALTAALAVQARTHVQCTHEAYQGQCVHCGAQIRNGRAMLAASTEDRHD